MKIFLILLTFININAFAKSTQPDSLLISDYFNALSSVTDVNSYIDIVFNDMSSTEKNDIKEFLKSKQIKLSQRMPRIELGDNIIKLGNKKVSSDFNAMTLKINGYKWSFNEKKLSVKELEKLTKYFDGTIGATFFMNRAFAEESATSYAAHGLEKSALLALGSYGVMSAVSKIKKGNVVNFDTGQGAIIALSTITGTAVGYFGAVASSALWLGQSLAVYLANGKAKYVCENGKIFIKIDGQLIAPEKLETNSVDSASILKHLSKTYTCTKTLTEEAAIKIQQLAKTVAGQEQSSSGSSNSNSPKTGTGR